MGDEQVGHGVHDAEWFDRKMRGQARRRYCQTCGASGAAWHPREVDETPWTACGEHWDSGPPATPLFDASTGERSGPGDE